MKRSEKLLVLGGDRRYISAADCFGRLGYDSRIFGFDSLPEDICAKREENLADALDGAKYLVLPLPYRKGTELNAPLYKGAVTLQTLKDLICSETVVFCGRNDGGLDGACAAVYDYSTREDFAILNAALTAEAAIGIALSELPTSLKETKTAVLGYGRIGRATARLLHGFGTNFTVYARRDEIFAMLESNSFAYSDIGGLVGLDRYDLIINTVPKLILTPDRLSQIKKGALYLELASEPGGADPDEASRLGIKTVIARGLPGKFSPVSAGRIICGVIDKIIYSGT